MDRGQLIDTWFAKNQDGINFRHRGNDSSYWAARVVNEYLAYFLQKQIGLPTPRVRHVCLWMDGEPTITMELEAPGEAFLEGNGISLDDYVSRTGWTGRSDVAGDPAQDNFDQIVYLLEYAADEEKTDLVRTHIAYESVQHALALFSFCSAFDQHFNWNVFQHRSASDGRWRQYPWDTDKSFLVSTNNGIPAIELHPYYMTDLHPGVYSTHGNLLAQCLFYPESGPGAEFTQPYRHRQQMTLWRYSHTIFSTNYLFSVLDELQSKIAPAYIQAGLSTEVFTDKIAEVKSFLIGRHNFYLNGTWSDKDDQIWNPTNLYDSSTVVINEIMANPLNGGEYLELYNPGHQTIDLSWWLLRCGDEEYHLPHGTLLAPTSYLAIADTQLTLTNAFVELGDSNEMILRFFDTGIWDWPVNWTTATEYASRLVEIPKLTLPDGGASIELLDLRRNIIDSVSYTNAFALIYAPSPSLELIDAALDNRIATNWRRSSVEGTPAMKNSSTSDKDMDGLDDEWEQRIVEDRPGSPASIEEVLPDDDYDGDGASNRNEFIAGTDPLDSQSYAKVFVHLTQGHLAVSMATHAPTGSFYRLYRDRRYSLEQTPALPTSDWTGITNYINQSATGHLLLYTNSILEEAPMFFRGTIHLDPLR